MNSRFKIYGLTLASAFILCGSYGQAAEVKLRVMAANLTSGTKQSYTPSHGIRIMRGLKADIILTQEFNYDSATLGSGTPEAIKEMVSRVLGTFLGPSKGYYYRESEPTDQIPNGIISRYPIIASGEWEDAELPNRDFAWARIKLPNGREVLAVSVHLYSKKSQGRENEARALVAKIKSESKPNDLIVLGGDFNTKSENESAIKILCEVVCEAQSARDPKGSSNTNMNGKYPYDWVFVNKAMQEEMVPTKIGPHEFPTGLIFDSTTFPALHLVKPISIQDSRAPGMQHLGVVKDFVIR